MDPFVWFDLGNNGGVLEVHEQITGQAPALELHLQFTQDGEPIAFWATDAGAFLGWVQIGAG